MNGKYFFLQNNLKPKKSVETRERPTKKTSKATDIHIVALAKKHSFLSLRAISAERFLVDYKKHIYQDG